ncbi:MAG: thioredoxin family protein [Dermatophilaceae bacterium]
MVSGSYVTYEQHRSAPPTSGAVVLFFHAPWCPDCRASDAALTNAGVPDGITVVKVDFDSMTDLRKKYGITQQHTFVQVDPAGTLVKKWSGSKDGNAIKSQLG